MLLSVLATSYVAWSYFESVEIPAEEPTLETTFICADDVAEGTCGRENSLAQLSGGEDRVSVRYDQIPPEVIAAVVSIEDREFFDHSGIDPVGVARAAYTNLRAGGVRQGGSSITQQYVKNAYLSTEQTVSRKLREAVLAIKLERELGKEEILERYLNTIYFGRGAYGVQAAARAYFGLDVGELSLPHAAYLAGLIQSPEEYDAYRGNSDSALAERARATVRRNQVLDAMLAVEVITADQVAAVTAIPLEDYVIPRDERGNFGNVMGAEYGSEYFVEYVLQELRGSSGLSDADLFGGGLRIYTTLDYEMQESAYQSVSGNLFPEQDDPAGSVITLDDNGHILAMVGGRDYQTSQVNLSTGVQGGGTGRQPGSAFKPFVLATAATEGISAESLFESKPEIVLPGANAGEDWIVRNHELADDGVLNLIQATQYSSNTVYAQLMTEVGAADVVATAHDMGITSDLPEVNSLVLGAGEVSVLDMASAYSTFMRSGERVDPVAVTRVETADGRPLAGLDLAPKREQVIDELTAQTVSWAMAQVVVDGTGTRANFGREVAGKTGTTEEYRDAWFVGFSCDITTAVWVGYDEANPDGTPRLMTNVRGEEVTGGSLPADIWRAHMIRATEQHPPCPIFEPYTYPGTILNPELATTTTTTLPCPDGTSRPVDDESEGDSEGDPSIDDDPADAGGDDGGGSAAGAGQVGPDPDPDAEDDNGGDEPAFAADCVSPATTEPESTTTTEPDTTDTTTSTEPDGPDTTLQTTTTVSPTSTPEQPTTTVASTSTTPAPP